MGISENFDFLKQEFPAVAQSATKAESLVNIDPRASLFRIRHALETVVIRVFKKDKNLKPPEVQQLSHYVADEKFQEIVGKTVWQKIELLRGLGNTAVHGRKAPSSDLALSSIEELFHVLYWVGRTYLRKGAEELKGRKYDPSVIPFGEITSTPEDIKKLEEELEKERKKNEELENEINEIEERVTQEIIEENSRVEETHDWGEAKTRKLIIDVGLSLAGWDIGEDDVEFEVFGMETNKSGKGYVDYVLKGDDGKVLAIVEAKRASKDPEVGQRQAELYANCLEKMQGLRPIIFYSNGYTTWLWDDKYYPPRQVSGFYSKEDLNRLIARRLNRKEITSSNINSEITDRPYQKRAIMSIVDSFAKSQRKALLVMATGTGKTRVAISIADVLQRANWAKRILFLADRKALVSQAVNAFKQLLPDSIPVNLLTEKNSKGRVYVSTYQTMMGLIDAKGGDGTNELKFGVGHFDLIIIDEAHRSIYRKYRTIFQYFDSLLIGLTATPRDQVDRNTYQLFGLKQGSPTDAYELDTAVEQGFLVPMKVLKLDLRFPSEGIDYDDLTDEEKLEWDELDWGEDMPPPSAVNAGAVNDWLFNNDTVDKVLTTLLERGHKVDGGDRLGKTIIFARNHDHAKFIEHRFNDRHSHYNGHFARVIDNYEPLAESLLDDFKQPNKNPHIAISVDMLDTGVDVPSVANLVFFKPVYSKIKFWQMIGRGTRLCPNLYGPGQDKENFVIFDACKNFEFFKENPDGLEASGGVSIGARIFKTRVDILSRLQTHEKSPKELEASIAERLHSEVSEMNEDNFRVRMHLEPVHKFTEKGAWDNLSLEDVNVLTEEVALLPSEIEMDGIEARMFDLLVLKAQLRELKGEEAVPMSFIEKVSGIAALLEDKEAIPAVKDQLAYICSIKEEEFWHGMGLEQLEELRIRMRNLVQFIDKGSRDTVYTDFEDEINISSGEGVPDLPRMAGTEYERKVKEFIDAQSDQLAIQKLKHNEPLTPTDLQDLEDKLRSIGEEDGERLLNGLLERHEAPTLPHFIRTLVGLERRAALSAFSQFLEDESLSSQQIRFVELIVDQLTTNGVMGSRALYEPPFVGLHAGGPEGMFEGKEKIIDGIFDALKNTEPVVSDAVG